MLLRLLGLPMSLPAAGLKFVFRTLAETAENELMDDGPVKEELLELQLQLEEGEIDEADYAEREQFLFQRLRDIRAYREQMLRERIEAARETGDEDDAGSGAAVIETGLDQYGER